MSCWGQIDSKKFFWKIWVEYKCFWKIFYLILMHFIHKILCFEEFLHKIALFFKNLGFPDFQSIECDFRSIEKFHIFQVLLLPNSIGIRSMLNRSKLKNFQFLSFWPNFFMHHLCLGFTCIVLFFVSILQFCSYISHCFHT